MYKKSQEFKSILLGILKEELDKVKGEWSIQLKDDVLILKLNK